MKKILLTKNKYALVDDSDYKELSKYKWCISNLKYAVRRMPKEASRVIYMHRVIANVREDQQVDHVNRDKLDNRRSNLRAASEAENRRNMPARSDNKSGYKGIHWDNNRKKYVVQICVNGRGYWGGRHKNLTEAISTYNSMATELHGEFAYLN